MAFEEGELIFLEEDGGKRHFLKVAFGMLKIQSLGTVDGSRLEGMDDGSVMTVAGRRLTAFRPGTMDLMGSLERGAQIVTPKDAASIIMNTDIRPGCRVLEVGAGSGGLTTALLMAVGPEGRVHTVEFVEENAKRAERNIRRAGLEGNWECQIGDARTAEVDFPADALVMDMPDPQNALDNLLPSLRPGGRVCAYVPNTNQMEAIVLALRERGFSSVIALENIQREMEVHPGGVRPSFDMLEGSRTPRAATPGRRLSPWDSREWPP